ncbi:MAG: hypothetical protein LW806_05090 [Planctomycetaceae bacterium]|nr:hypothetical protein [Planctomycetaceae bacterium]
MTATSPTIVSLARNALAPSLLPAMVAATALQLTACGESPKPTPPLPVEATAQGGQPTATATAAPAAPGAPSDAAAPASAPASAATAFPPREKSDGPKVDQSKWRTSTSADDPAALEVAGLRAPKPTSWVWTKPSMQFRTLQYSVPGEGDSTKQAELIVSVFVDGDGGPLDANIERWRNQFRVGDRPPEAKRSTKKIGPLDVELVELAGDYMAMGSPAPKRDFLQLAAIVQAEGRNVFFRLVGPTETVEANRANFDKLVDGIMPAD